MSKKVKEVVIGYENYQGVRSIKWPEDVMMKISNKRGINMSDLKNIMAYNVMTVGQVVLVTGRAEDGIRTKLQPRWLGKKKEFYAALTACYPFPTEAKGPMFVLVDDKLRQLVNESAEE